MPRRLVGASALLAGLVIPAVAQAARVDYTLDGGVENNDNVTLAQSDPIEQNYLRGGLGFVVTEATSFLDVQLDGRVEYRNYEDSIFGDTVDGTLSGRLNWIVIPRRLFFTVEDSLTTQSVDSLAPDAPGNRQQVNVLSAGPTFLINWSESFQAQAELRYVDSDAEITDEFNSQRLALALRTVKELSASRRISLNVQGQEVDFDNDVVARDYRRYDVYARYAQTLARFELGADAGYSRIDYRGAESRSEPLLRVDATWNPSERSSLSVLAASEFSDTASDALDSIQSDATVPDTVLTGDAVVNASPYEVRMLDLGYSFQGVRATFSVMPFFERRNYVDSDTFDQDTRGIRADMSWLLRPSLRLSVYGSEERLEYTQLGRQDDTRRIGSRLRYQWTRNWSAGLLVERYVRRSDDPSQSASQNTVYLSISYSNR
jgi:hypothetical protein